MSKRPENVIVQFTEADEFLQELALRPPNVEKLVRLCCMERLMEGAIRHISVVAGFLVSHGDGNPTTIVEFRQFVGQAWTDAQGKFEEPDKTTFQRAETVMQKLKAGIAERNLDTASGIYAAPRKDGQ